MRLRLVGLSLVALACGDVANPATPPRILYIGNSLTYQNDLPDIVAALARAAGQMAPTTASVTFGGYSLSDHLTDGTAVRTLQGGRWDYVILQQGPSSLDESRAQLISDVEKLAPMIRAAGGIPALYSVWPESARFEVFDRVDTSYAKAAAAVNGLLIPAGEAWQAAWRTDPTLPLYGDDKFHPSVMGSYLAALCIYGQIYRQTPVGLPARFAVNSASVGTIDIFPPTATVLQNAAAEAMRAAGAASVARAAR